VLVPLASAPRLRLRGLRAGWGVRGRPRTLPRLARELSSRGRRPRSRRLEGARARASATARLGERRHRPTRPRSAAACPAGAALTSSIASSSPRRCNSSMTFTPPSGTSTACCDRGRVAPHRARDHADRARRVIELVVLVVHDALGAPAARRRLRREPGRGRGTRQRPRCRRTAAWPRRRRPAAERPRAIRPGLRGARGGASVEGTVRVIGRARSGLLRRVAGRRRPAGLILCYHHVGGVEVDPWLLCVSPEKFAEQLAVLRATADAVPLDRL